MSFQGRIPTTISTAPTAIAPNAGHRKLRLRLSMEVLRHASNGPTAVSSKSSNATGTLTRLKNGGPTVTLFPWTHSDRTGNSVPHNTVKQATRSRRLLNRKLDSREISDSSLCSLRRCDLFLKKKNANVTRVISRNHINQSPIEDFAKACTR